MEKYVLLGFVLLLLGLTSSVLMVESLSAETSEGPAVIMFVDPTPQPSYTARRCQSDPFLGYQCVLTTYNFPVADNCYNNFDCDRTYSGCNSANPPSCVTYRGKQEDECETSQDCQEKTHTDCRYVNGAWQCAVVSGADVNECAPQYPERCGEETHNICNDFKCVPGAGFGPNQCNTDYDCGIPLPKKCDYLRLQCSIMSVYGMDECSTNFVGQCPILQYTDPPE